MPAPDHFTLLGLAPAFDLDIKELEQAYFREQRTWHPDRFTGKTSLEKQRALLRSVDLNVAYDALKDPLARAQYLLKMQGIRVGTEQDSIKPSMEVLTEAMEWREEADAAADVPAQEKVEKTLSDLAQRSIDSISKAYRGSHWDAMAQEALRLSYLLKTKRDLTARRQRLKK